MGRALIHERTVTDAAREGKKSVAIPPGALVTESAREAAHRFGIRLVEGETKASAPQEKSAPALPPAAGALTVALGSDHGGFPLKEALKPHLEQLGCKVIDVGTTSADACDYPDFAYAVARLVSTNEAHRGIMIDAVGVASAMVANKVPGIRAACCSDEFAARSSREHNDANVLTLGGRVLGVELAKAIVKVWIEMPYAGGRHQKRIEKIRDIENAFLREKRRE